MSAYPPIQITRTDLLRHLGRDQGWSRDPGDWDDRQTADGDDIVNLAVLQFYNPMILPGERTQHEWTFMSPWSSMTTQADKDTYDLPEDFGGMADEITFVSDNSGPCPVRIVSDVQIRRLHQRAVNTTGYPDCACIVPAPADGTRPQIWHITFFPKPDGEYTLRLRYRSNPSQIMDSAPYPLGGQPTADALLASVLCAGESRMKDEQGIRYVEYVEKLRAAVSWDRSHNVQTLGYCGDPSVGEYMPYQPTTRLYYNGVEL